MAKQLVLSNNRVLAHGEDCFLCMGGTVICTKSGRKWDNATVATYDCACPADIDEAGYEYRAGEFVPCAPFGKATGGTIPVLCDDCKTIKDSGYLLPNFARWQLTASGNKFIYLIGSPSQSSTELFSPSLQSVGNKIATSGFRPLISGTVNVNFRCRTSSSHFVLYMQVDDEEPKTLISDIYHSNSTLRSFSVEINVNAGSRYTFYFDYRSTNSDFTSPLRLAEFSIYATAPDVSVVSEAWSDAAESTVSIIDPMAQLRADVDYIAAQAGVTL